MGWRFWSRREPSPELLDAVEDLRRRLKTAELDVAELGDRFRRWQARTAKRAALDEEAGINEEGAPARPAPRAALPTVSQLRAAGKLRW